MLALERSNFESNPSKQETIANAIKTALVTDEKFVVQNITICRACWRTYYGISRSTYYRIRKLIKSGTRVNFERKRRVYDKSATTVSAMAWLDLYARTYGDFQPDFEEIHVPDYNFKYLWDKYRQDQTANFVGAITYDNFIKSWKREKPSIKLRKYKRFAQCDECASFDEQIDLATTHTQKKYWASKKQVHLDWQQKERLKYHKHCQKAWFYPDKYLSISIDGMDHSKTSLPAFRRETKSSGAQEKLDVHVTGVLVHGQWPYAMSYQWTDNFASDSNVTINVLLDVLQKVIDHRRKYHKPMPKTLYLQMDNCSRENKNKYMLAINHLLVYNGVFMKVKMSFLPVGHTHEDVDQMFSRFATHLKGRHVITLYMLHSCIRNAYNPVPLVVHLTEVACWNKYLAPMLQQVEGITKPRVIITRRDPDDVVRHYYKMDMQTSKKADPTCVLPLNRKGFTLFGRRGFPSMGKSGMSIPLTPTKALRLAELTKMVDWLETLPSCRESHIKWWRDFLEQQRNADASRCAECVRLREGMTLCRKDCKDSKDVARAKGRQLYKLDKELGEHILRSSPGHKYVDVKFPRGTESDIAALRTANAAFFGLPVPEEDDDDGSSSESDHPEEQPDADDGDNVHQDGSSSSDDDVPLLSSSMNKQRDQGAAASSGVCVNEDESNEDPTGDDDSDDSSSDDDAPLRKRKVPVTSSSSSHVSSSNSTVDVKAPDGEGDSSSSDSDEARLLDVAGGIAAEEHWTGSRSAAERVDLPSLGIGMMVIINAGKVRRNNGNDDDYWSRRPFWVGKVTCLLENGYFQYQQYGKPDKVWNNARYLPGWYDKSRKKHSDDLPKEIYTTSGNNRTPIIDKAHSSCVFWWFEKLNKKGTIPRNVQLITKRNPRYTERKE